MSNMPGDCGSTHPDGKDTHHHMHPHVECGKSRVFWLFFAASLLAADSPFCAGVEVHPIFIYIYGMMEIRETSEKTKENGKMRILATLTAVGGTHHVFDRLALGAVAGASLPALGEASILLAEACLSYARQNYWDAMRFAGWQLQSISF